MSKLLRIIGKLPIPTALKLEWQRELLDYIYAKEISIARKSQDHQKIEEIEHERRFEIDLHTEELDLFITKQLLKKANKLRVPTPHRYNADKTESDHWYEGHYTMRWMLTNKGVTTIRDEIRRELKARHEVRAQLVVWLSALTGVIGAITGLVALLSQRSP